MGIATAGFSQCCACGWGCPRAGPKCQCLCDARASSGPTPWTRTQRWSGRTQLSVRAAQFENRELLVGDCTSLLSFCLYKQVRCFPKRGKTAQVYTERPPAHKPPQLTCRCQPWCNSQIFLAGWNLCTSIHFASLNSHHLLSLSAGLGWLHQLLLEAIGAHAQQVCVHAQCRPSLCSCS